MLGWGMYIGSRRELLWTLRHRAERAEAEQELRVAQARGNERARIAREMHDVLAHRISQISMHAGALGFRDDLTADEMRASAAVIQDKAHEALTDLRGVLGVLRDAETGEPARRPAADVRRPAAAGRRGARGRAARRVRRPARRADAPVPDAVGRTLYRIVQEGITNAAQARTRRACSRIAGQRVPRGRRRHRAAQPARLRRPAGRPGAGLGLVGLTERAELRGGRLEHRRDGPTFVLHGWIPWAA